METKIPYQQIKQIVENIPDVTWTPKVPDNIHEIEKYIQQLNLVPNKVPKLQKRLSNNVSLLQYPAELDWRKIAPNCITEIRNQGGCGACWAFSTVAEFSERRCIALNQEKVTQYSEGFLIGCDPQNTGCSGGYLLTAQDFLQQTGLVPDSCVSFQSGNGATQSCQTKCDDGSPLPAPDKISGYWDPCSTHDTLLNAIQSGPIVTQMQVFADFFVYSSGVYRHVYGDLSGYHGVTIVGYGTDPEEGDYWIVQNSWGPGFGENGFFRIARFVNECQIEVYCYASSF